MADPDRQVQTPHANEVAELQARHDASLTDTVKIGNVDVVRSLLDDELRSKAERYLEHYARYPGTLSETEMIQLKTLQEGGVDALETMASSHVLGQSTAGIVDWATENAINREAGMIDAKAIIDGMYGAALERDTGGRTDSSSCRVEDLGDLSSPTFTAQKNNGCGFVKGGG